MRQIAAKENGLLWAVGHELRTYDTHTNKSYATQHNNTMYLSYTIHTQHPGDATVLRGVINLGNSTHLRQMSHTVYQRNHENLCFRRRIVTHSQYMLCLAIRETFTYFKYTRNKMHQSTQHLDYTTHSGSQTRLLQTAVIELEYAKNVIRTIYVDWTTTRKALSKVMDDGLISWVTNCVVIATWLEFQWNLMSNSSKMNPSGRRSTCCRSNHMAMASKRNHPYRHQLGAQSIELVTSKWYDSSSYT